MKKRKNSKEYTYHVRWNALRETIWMAIHYAHGHKEALIMKNVLVNLQASYYHWHSKPNIIIEDSKIKEKYSLKKFTDLTRAECNGIFSLEKVQCLHSDKPARYFFLSLEEIIDIIIPYAIRYAHGRHTFAPCIVRDEVRKLQHIGFKLRRDITIKAPTHKLTGVDFRSNYLDDLFEGE